MDFGTKLKVLHYILSGPFVLRINKCFCPLNSSCVFKCDPLNATSAGWKQKRLGFVLFSGSLYQHPARIPIPKSLPPIPLFTSFIPLPRLPIPPPPLPRSPVSGGDFSARPISSIGPPSIQTTSPVPSPPLALLFHTLPVPLTYPPTPGLGLGPHQCLCVSLIRRTAPAAAIRVESCREPESKLCRNQKAILTLLNLPALFITTTREEDWSDETTRECTKPTVSECIFGLLSLSVRVVTVLKYIFSCVCA